MANCHACRETYVNGEILCSHCGADLDEIKPIVSRLHAALQLDAGRPAIKALTGPNGTTWTRHSGDDRWSPVPPNTVRLLENRDAIVLGHPRGRRVSLRVVFSHP